MDLFASPPSHQMLPATKKTNNSKALSKFNITDENQPDDEVQDEDQQNTPQYTDMLNVDEEQGTPGEQIDVSNLSRQTSGGSSVIKNCFMLPANIKFLK